MQSMIKKVNAIKKGLSHDDTDDEKKQQDEKIQQEEEV